MIKFWPFIPFYFGFAHFLHRLWINYLAAFIGMLLNLIHRRCLRKEVWHYTWLLFLILLWRCFLEFDTTIAKWFLYWWLTFVRTFHNSYHRLSTCAQLTHYLWTSVTKLFPTLDWWVLSILPRWLLTIRLLTCLDQFYFHFYLFHLWFHLDQLMNNKL